MLNDGYVEQIVKGKAGSDFRVPMIGGIVFVVLGAFLFLMTIFTGSGLLMLMIGIGMIIFGSSRKNIEYEYLLVNDDVEVSKIIAKNSRKQVCNFKNTDVKLITKPGSVYLDNEHQKNSYIKSRDYTDGKEDSDLYVFVLSKGDKIETVTLKLSEKTLDHVNYYFKGKYKE